MSIDPDITADLSTPNLTAVKVVAATRGITVAAARDQLLAEWDERLASAITSEADMAGNWLATARDHLAAGDLATAELDIDAARECIAVIETHKAKRDQAAAMRRMNAEHPHLGDQNYR